jgi:hypothetical protein
MVTGTSMGARSGTADRSVRKAQAKRKVKAAASRGAEAAE